MLQPPGDAFIGQPVCASPQETSQQELVERAIDGDSGSFTILFQLYNAQICAYLSNLVGNDELGRDLAQETFLRAWKSLPAMRKELLFKPWLYRIATNVARSYQRHERLLRWLPWQDAMETRGETHGNSTNMEEKVSEAEYVQQVLSTLSPQYRTCLLLQLVAGFSQREIASMLGISEKSVSANVSRGREQFRLAARKLKGDVRDV